MKSCIQSPRALFAFAFALFFLVWIGLETEVFARAGGGRTSGRTSTGATRTYQKPPAQQADLQQQRTPSASAPMAPSRGIFSGIGGMVFGGILGAMLFRSLGFAGNPEWGKEGFAFGDLFLLMILLALIFFVFKHFRKRPAMSLIADGPASFSGPGVAYSSFPAGTPPSAPALQAPLLPALQHIRNTDPAFNESDFLTFAEETFKRIQQSWGKRDWNGMRHLLSPEMSVLFQRDIDQLLTEKRINRIENIEIQGAEISDALQDRGEDLITVKMAVHLNDYTVDEQTAQVLSGDPQVPVEFTESWTFSRSIGERNWVLAGISQNSVQ